MFLHNIKVLDLLKLPNQAIIAIRNDRRKEISLTFSFSPLSTIDRLKTDLKRKYKHKGKLREFRIIIHPACFYDRTTALLNLSYYEQKYTQLGYTSIKRLNGLYYKTSIEIGDKVAYVVLSSRNRNKQVIGVFDKIVDAEIFISEFYSSGSVLYPVVALNKLTRDYFIKKDDYRNIKNTELRKMLG